MPEARPGEGRLRTGGDPPPTLAFVEIRPAEPSDVPSLAEWTQDTFSWGDYIADRLPDWLQDPRMRVLVAEDSGFPVAMGAVVMLSPTEAWAQGMRVHPEHRRRGIGTTLSEELWAWARERGAEVVRLAVEEDNAPARGQVGAMGFRKVCEFLRGGRVIGAGSPVPEGNGGRRVPPPERLSPAHSAEAEPAFLSWTTGELARVARGLAPEGWRWRRLNSDHLVAAARSRQLFEGRPGWAIAAVREGMLHVEWVETARTDAAAMALALVDRAADADLAEIRVWIPTVPWLRRALQRLGFEFHETGVWALPL
jgi:ribosomal protein S18 acetylase RimI-like enzyme